MQVTVRDLMMLDLVTLDETASIAEATKVILNQALSEVYVRDLTGRLIGTVTDYALLKAKLLRTDPAASVTRVMSRSMLVLRPEARLEDVAGMFRDSCHSRLAVVENGQLIGQVNRRDVLRTMLVLEEQQTTSDSIRRIEIASSIMPNKPQFLDEMMGAKMPMAASDSIQPSL